jgi:hypothetical protein
MHFPLPRILNPTATPSVEELPAFDTAGVMLKHVLGKDLKPLIEDYKSKGKLL